MKRLNVQFYLLYEGCPKSKVKNSCREAVLHSPEAAICLDLSGSIFRVGA